MKNEYVINLSDINNLRQFTTDILYKVDGNVDAIYERQVVDAKSLLGLSSIAMHNIRVVIHTENLKELKEFKKICEKYAVK